MSGLCGWFRLGAGAAAPADIQAMAASLGRFDGARLETVADSRGALAVADLAGEAYVHRDADLLVAVWGRPDPAASPDANPAASLAQAYRSQGPSVLSRLTGPFAAAVLDEGKGEVLLTIDRMGVRPLNYCVAGDYLLFGSSHDAINAHPAARREIDPQGVFNYLYFHMVPGAGTIYAGRQRLLPGEYVLWRSGKAESGRHWEMRFEEGDRRPFGGLQADFLAVLQEGVREEAGEREVGTFLSGGTDSSTLAGMLGKVTGRPARTYSIGFAVEGFDEMEYARIAAKHFGTDHHEYYVTPDDVCAAIPQLAAIYDQPFGNSSAVPTYYCAKMARADGVTRLLGGDGGDELFGGNARYAKQHIFSLYERVPPFLRRGVIEPLAFGLPGGGKLPPVRKVRSYIRQASVPMPARLETYNLLERFGYERVFAPDFLRQVDRRRPIALLNGVYHHAHAHTQINRMLALDLKFTLADNDLPKVARTCELAAMDVAFPMLNDRVVAFSARLAPELKLKGTKLRYFFKEALRGFLPDEILVKKKHGFGLPFGYWLQTHKPLQELVYGSLQDLKKRDIVRPAFLDELTGMRLADHPGYYGTMVWVLMMLELWYAKHLK